MRELTLILTDFYIAPDLRAALAESPGQAGSLPALELLLARARERRTADWRALAGEMVRAPFAPQVPVAAIARQSPDLQRAAAPGSGQLWIATPVHLVAALDHVQLSEVLALTADEWRLLIAAFNSEWGSDSGVLEEAAGSEAFFRPARALAAQSTDPARVAGRDVDGALPDGEDGPRLRQLMTEVQMWLHDHPVNRAREQGGLPAVNGLWFWGGGSLPEQPYGNAAARLVSDDRFMRGLWSLAGGSARSLPERLEDSLADSPATVIALAVRELRGGAWFDRLRQLEAAWLVPALSALRARTVDRLQLHANDRLFVVHRSDLWRFWRRTQPWLEALT